MTTRRLTSLFAALALAVAACTAASNAEVGSSETPSAILITSGSGNVSVSAGGTGVSVTAAINSSEDPPWSAEMVGDNFVVNDGCAGIAGCEVDLTIEVDATADVEINSADGAVTIVDMNSSVTIAGAASNVVLNGITGPIDVNLSSGDLLGARLVSTVAFFNTGEGDLDVTLTEQFQSLVVASGRGNVTAQVPGGSYDIDAVTDDGGVEINVDDVDGSAATIMMRTGSGDVTIYRR